MERRQSRERGNTAVEGAGALLSFPLMSWATDLSAALSVDSNDS